MSVDTLAVSLSPMEMVASASQSTGRESQWFNSERFLDPNFNAEQYVADLRRYVSVHPPGQQHEWRKHIPAASVSGDEAQQRPSVGGALGDTEL